MDIPDIEINIDDIRIPDIQTYQPPRWATDANAIFAAPPVTQEVGVPIVDMPGCVEAHEQNTRKEKSGILSEDDPKGVKVFCDAGVPSFNPLDYNKDEMEFKYEQKVPPVRPPEQPEVTPPAATAPKTDKAVTVTCPTPAQEAKEPVGSLVEGFKKKNTLIKWDKWVKTDDVVPLPKVLEQFKNKPIINCEFIGGKLIEAHFRSNPDFPDNRKEFIPVWEGQDKNPPEGYQYIDYPDVHGRIGAFIKY